MSRKSKLPAWNPAGGGLVCARIGPTPCVNIPCRIAHHSPTGIEWGYEGSGPADLSLNLANLLYPPGCDGFPGEKLWKGRCSTLAWMVHQLLKRTIVAKIPQQGGAVPGPLLRRAALLAAMECARTADEPVFVRAGMLSCYHVFQVQGMDCFACYWCEQGWSLNWSAPTHVIVPVAEALAEHPFSCEGAQRVLTEGSF